MKVITKTYGGAQDRRLIPVIKDDAGVAGDNFSTVLRFKISKSYENLYKYIEWDLVDPKYDEKFWEPLSPYYDKDGRIEGYEYAIPGGVTRAGEGRTICYNLIFQNKIRKPKLPEGEDEEEDDDDEEEEHLTTYIEKSEPGSVFFIKSAQSALGDFTEEETSKILEMINDAVINVTNPFKTRTLQFSQFGGKHITISLGEGIYLVSNKNHLESLVDALPGELAVIIGEDEEDYMHVYTLLNKNPDSIDSWHDVTRFPLDDKALNEALDIIRSDILLYQLRDEKNMPDGYIGADDQGKVDNNSLHHGIGTNNVLISMSQAKAGEVPYIANVGGELQLHWKDLGTQGDFQGNIDTLENLLAIPAPHNGDVWYVEEEENAGLWIYSKETDSWTRIWDINTEFLDSTYERLINKIRNGEGYNLETDANEDTYLSSKATYDILYDMFNKLPEDIVSEIELTPTVSSIILTVSRQEKSTGDDTTQTLTIPKSTPTLAGLMTPEQNVKLAELEDIIEDFVEDLKELIDKKTTVSWRY